MSDGFVPELTIAPYEQDLEPEEFRALIYGAATSQRIRWWQACLNPGASARSGSQTTERWLHEERDVADFRAAISDGRTMQRYVPQGTLQSGDMTILVMPDEIALGDHDWVVPLGRQAGPPIPGIRGNAPLLQRKEMVVRGARNSELTGTVSSAGPNVTGQGTAFRREAPVGRVLMASGRALRVVEVVDDRHLTVESAPTPAWNGNSGQVACERLACWPVDAIVDIRDADRVYRVGTDVAVDPDDGTLRWTDGRVSPAPGAGIAVIYRHYPRYEVIGDLGLVNHAVNSVPLPQSFVLRLIRPDMVSGG